MPLNVVVPLELQLSSEETSENEDLPDFVENPNQASTKDIVIEKESTPTETLIPKSTIRKKYISESSKIKKPLTYEEMTAMFEAVHKLIDKMTEKTPLPPASQPPMETIASLPHVGSSVPLSSLI